MKYWDECNKKLAHLSGKGEEINHQRWGKYLVPYTESFYPTVIDYGCGGNWLGEFIRKYITTKRWIGLDTSERAIKHCRNKFDSNDSVSVYYFGKVPEKLLTTSVLFCMSVVQHMNENQLIYFERQLDESNIPELFIQIRHSEARLFDGLNPVHCCSLPKLKLKNYKLIHSSEILTNNYQYQIYEVR